LVLLFKSHEKFTGRGGGGTWNEIMLSVLFIVILPIEKNIVKI
jgi:hypothetical protein